MHQFSLRTILIVFSVVLAVAATAALGFLAERIAAQNLEQRIGEQFSRRTQVIANSIDRAMYERYHDIQLQAFYFSQLKPVDGRLPMREHLDRLSSENEGYAWIGVSDRDGEVVAATKGMLEGADVSQRPWFVEGSLAAFIGDLHRAIMLEKKMAGDDGQPLRFLDIAVPLTDEEGVFQGVLGAHIDWRWIKDITTSLPRSISTEVLIISANGTVLLGPRDLQDQELSPATFSRTRRGRMNYQIERWPDGKTYLSGFAKSKGYKDYPGLGWTLVERQEVSQAFLPIKALRQKFILWGIAIAAFFAALGWLVAARISRPLTEVMHCAESLAHAQPRANLPVIRAYREVMVLSHSLSALIAELMQREVQLEHQATHHTLTGLPNRAVIKAVLHQAITHSRESKLRISVLILDMDRFNTVNDAAGYASGDELILAVADRLKRCVGAKGTLGHLGKDEFVVVLAEPEKSLSQTSSLCTAIQEEIGEAFRIAGSEFSLSISIGISHFPQDGKDADALLGSSMLALRQAKAKGGNRIEFYEAQMNASVMQRMKLERDLRQALEQERFELLYQPQISLKTGAMMGVEALLRWRHPEHGLIAPDKFIPVAELSGLIVPLGEWALNEACRQAQAWRSEGLPPLRMGVNVSVQQFNDDGFVRTVSNALRRSQLDPSSLKLEITESLLMHDMERSIAMMHEMTALGVHFSMDDFGTGYSSLGYLKQFPISELKIDKMFVRDLDSEEDDATIIQAIISLGHSLNLSVIAEGVETSEQFDFLQRCGCDEMQGHFFSKPVPAKKISELLPKNSFSARVAGATDFDPL